MKQYFLVLIGLCLMTVGCRKSKSFTYCKDASSKSYSSILDFKTVLTKDAKKQLVLNRYEMKIDSLFELESELSKQGYILTRNQMLELATNYIDFKTYPRFSNSRDSLANVCLKIRNRSISYDKLDKAFTPKTIQVYLPMAISDNIIKAKKAAIDELIKAFPSLEGINRAGLDLLFHESELTIKNLMEKNDSENTGAMFTGSVYPIVVEALKSGDYIVEDGSKITAGLAGIDKNGKTAIFQVIVLSDKYNWKFANDNKIEYLNTGNQADILLPIQSPAIQSNIKNLLDIIAIGTASCEGSIDAEFERSKRRANMMAQLLNQYYGQNLDIPIQTLYLGKYIGNCINNTARQRKVVLVGTTYKEKDVNVGEALQNMLKDSRSPLDVEKYSHFQIQPYSSQSETLTSYKEM
mgnify:CR=1 FL=1